MIEFIILGFLMEQDMTGYAIRQKMSISTSNFIEASFGSIYPALKKLEHKNLIYAEEVIENGKLKKVYSLTAHGREEFLRWLNSPIEASKTSVTTALAKVFFFNHTSRESVNALLTGYIHDLGQFQDNLIQLEKKVHTRANAFELSTLHFGIDFYNFTINWYKNYLAKLDE